jgi:hypothetical protein
MNEATLVAGIDVDAIAEAVAACPSVSRLSGGRFGEVATYLPGRRVTGIRVATGAIEVHVVALWVPSLLAISDEVRTALASLELGRPVQLFIDDVTVEDINWRTLCNPRCMPRS